MSSKNSNKALANARDKLTEKRLAKIAAQETRKQNAQAELDDIKINESVSSGNEDLSHVAGSELSAGELISLLTLKRKQIANEEMFKLITILADFESSDIDWCRYYVDSEYRDHIIAVSPGQGYTRLLPTRLPKFCHVLDCGEIPTYDFSGESPCFCELHSVPGMVDVVTTKCCGTGCSAYVNKTGFCAQCDTTRPRKTRVREHQVANFLRENLSPIWTSWNKQLANSRECSERGGYLPDFLYDCGSFVIILEVDEDQHAKAGYSCDERRMVDCFNSCGGVPVMFIRLNPDAYKQAKIPMDTVWEDRLATLLKVMQHFLLIALLSILHTWRMAVGQHQGMAQPCSPQVRFKLSQLVMECGRCSDQMERTSLQTKS